MMNRQNFQQKQNKNMYVVKQPTDICWQIGGNLKSLQHLLLLGWEVDEIDAGVPDAVVEILVEALCNSATIIFPTSEKFSRKKPIDIFLDFLPLPNFGTKLLSRMIKIPAKQGLVSSKNANLVTKLFQGSLFSWELQSTFALLSNSNKIPSIINFTSLEKLIDNEKWLAEFYSIANQTDIFSLIKPTTDGDAMAILFQSKNEQTEFLHNLEETTSKYQFKLIFHSENDYKTLT